MLPCGSWRKHDRGGRKSTEGLSQETPSHTAGEAGWHASRYNVKYREYDLMLEPGSKLFVYTDGLAEAIGEEQEQFGLDRIVATLNKNPDSSPLELLDTMSKEVDSFVHGAEQFDDLTMRCLEYTGPHEN